MTNADMKVEIIKDPACGCLGCEAERKTKALIEQSFRSFGPEIERIQALEYRDERAIKRSLREPRRSRKRCLRFSVGARES
jgi:hypothetical protein